MMRFYQQQHEFYCGVDLHSNCLYVCVVDAAGNKLLHRNFKNNRLDLLLAKLQPYLQADFVLACESTFNWYWLADWCADNDLPFLLGHALYMKAIHGGKTKNDAIDSEKIARLVRGGNFPVAHVYPQARRATRDLMRRRTYLVRRRAETLAHIQMLHLQQNLPKPGTRVKYKSNRAGVGDNFADPSAKLNVNIDLALLRSYDEQIHQMELHLEQTAKVDDANQYFRLQTIPGVGLVLAWTILYEIGSIDRFPSVGDFLSYARLVRGSHTSNGKRYAATGSKIGNPHLKWAFGEAAVLLKRELPAAAALAERIEKRQNKMRALTMLSVKLGRAVYYMMKRQEVFDPSIFKK